jgi:hypothetical protein
MEKLLTKIEHKLQLYAHKAEGAGNLTSGDLNEIFLLSGILHFSEYKFKKPGRSAIMPEAEFQAYVNHFANDHVHLMPNGEVTGGGFLPGEQSPKPAKKSY